MSCPKGEKKKKSLVYIKLCVILKFQMYILFFDLYVMLFKVLNFSSLNDTILNIFNIAGSIQIK